MKSDPRPFIDPAFRRDVRFLTSLLGEIIQEQEGPPFFRTVERIRTLAKKSRQAARGKIADLRRAIQNLPFQKAMKVARAFTIYFQLVNLAEEAQRIRRIRWYESQPGSGLEMSLTWTAHRLNTARVPARTLAKNLQQTEVVPVLTAHPTEVRRRTTMDHLADAARALEAYNHPLATPLDRRRAERDIRETLEILWVTNESRQRKLTVADEVSQTLFFIERTILKMVPELYESLGELATILDPSSKMEVPTLLTFGSWVGADRDGNPNVTPEVTWETAKTHHRVILEYYSRRLEELIRKSSQADNLMPVSRKLLSSLEEDQKQMPEEARMLARYEGPEPYRKKLSFMHTRILRTDLGSTGGYASARQLIEDLQIIRSSLESHGSRYAAQELRELIRQVETFGFHLARLEFREHRDRILQAVGELLPKVLKREIHYESLSESERQEILRQALAARRPSSCRFGHLSATANDILEQFRTIKRIQRELDPELVKTYLVSMTRTPSDILSVVALGSWTGLAKNLDIVPLFETIPDLVRSQEIMESLWADPVYKRYLAGRKSRQEVMLGYSDANKDGGYLAANWALYQAQARLARSAGKHGIKLVLFHGKGGTIDRGGGLSHRAIVAQPFAAPECRIKITEQGEVVAAKYSHPVIARRNIEQLVSAVLLANLIPEASSHDESQMKRWEAMMEELVDISERAYRSFVFEDPDFTKYYLQATPIQIMLEAPIAGTRPGARPIAADKEQTFSVQRLRAIPWVFSWVQSRHMLSAWYGIGSAIETFRRRHGPKGFQELKKMGSEWPFAKVVLENAQASLAKADLKIARAYASLVEPPVVRERIFHQIQAEYRKAVSGVLALTGSKTLLEGQPVLGHSILLRNPYVDPLHILQIRGLQELRRSPSSSSAQWLRQEEAAPRASAQWLRQEEAAPRASAQWLELVKLTIHGVAYGMKSTG